MHVGGPPALVLAAIAPLPENIPEVLLASLVLGKSELCPPNGSGDLPLVARAEFVLAGKITPVPPGLLGPLAKGRHARGARPVELR